MKTMSDPISTPSISSSSFFKKQLHNNTPYILTPYNKASINLSTSPASIENINSESTYQQNNLDMTSSWFIHEIQRTKQQQKQSNESNKKSSSSSCSSSSSGSITPSTIGASSDGSLTSEDEDDKSKTTSTHNKKMLPNNGIGLLDDLFNQLHDLMDVDSGSAAFHADDELPEDLIPQSKLDGATEPIVEELDGIQKDSKSRVSSMAKQQEQSQFNLPLTLPLNSPVHHRKRRRRSILSTTMDKNINSSIESNIQSLSFSTTTNNSMSSSVITGSSSSSSCSSPFITAISGTKSIIPSTSITFSANTNSNTNSNNNNITTNCSKQRRKSNCPVDTKSSADDDKGGPVRDKCMRCSMSAKKTPMMRKGPDGCRSLCNACGLKWSRHGIY